MTREIITIDVGGAGVNLGSTIWQQFNLEHNIYKQGNKSAKDEQDYTFRTF